MEQSFPKKNNIAIVGGGPAGVYCAVWISKKLRTLGFKDYTISIFEKDKILKTILKTGNSRCNLTNFEPDLKEFASNYPRGEKFILSLLSRHSNLDVIDFFNSIGVKTYSQDDGRIFPVSNKSSEIRNALLAEIYKDKNIKIINKKIIDALDIKDFNKIIISAGSRNSENLIKSFSHTLVPFKKSLCALNISNFIYPKGVSVKALDGDFVFTEKGISGPLAFYISSLNSRKEFPYKIKINLFDPLDLYDAVQKNPKAAIGKLLSNFIPKSLAHVITDNYYKHACEIKKEKIASYSTLELEIISNSSLGEIVNSGGVELSELDKNAKSKIRENLWFCGEILDIDGFCGGFNLQNCWSGGWVVANDVVRSIIN